MTAAPATTGQVPQRTDPNRPAEGVTRITSADHEFLEDAVFIPPVNERWHRLARGLYLSVAKSGESVLFEPSDWAVLYMVCESISRDFKPQFVGMLQPSPDGDPGGPQYEAIPLKGTSLTAYLKVLSDLGLTEGSRRRLRVEIMRGKQHTGLAPVRNIVETREEALARRDVG